MLIRGTFLQQYFKMRGPQLWQLAGREKFLKRNQKLNESPIIYTTLKYTTLPSFMFGRFNGLNLVIFTSR